MDEHERALMNAIVDIDYLTELNRELSPDYTQTYNRAIRHAANSIREILKEYRDMK